ISYFSTCECLSDKRKYPSFLRTIPSDYFQSRALAEMVKHFGWTWVGALRRDDDYGNSGMAAFTEIAEQLGICLEYSLPYFRTYSKERVLRIIDQIKISTSRVIVGFFDTWDLETLLPVFFEHNITGYQWVGTEAWIVDPELAILDKNNILQGAIGLAIPKANVTGLEDFILDVKPLKSVGSAIFPEFWEAMFDCKYTVQNDSEGVPVCTGEEKLSDVRNTFTDMSLMPFLNNVYKGVYAIAHTLHKILGCKKTCPTKQQPDPSTISHYATCECLSDKRKYPTFLRTIPSDSYQSRALAEMIKHFGWTWLGAIRRDDDYGNNGMTAFTKIAEQLGICLEYSLPYFKNYSTEKVQKIIDQIKVSTSQVILGFLDNADLESLLPVFFEHNITGYQWVGTEAWIFDPKLAISDKNNILQGAIGLAIPKAKVTGMQDFILDIKPLKSVGSAIFPEFWETMFGCKYTVQNDSEGVPVCTGEEKLSDVESVFTDMSMMPIFSNVYKGVYAIAHALNNLLHCNKSCPTKQQPDPLTIWKDGDIVVGGAFPFYSSWETIDLSYVVMPPPMKCMSLDLRALQFSQTLIFAVEEINNSSSLLPGVSLGYKIYDTCSLAAQGIRIAMALVNGNENTILNNSCTKPAQVQAIIGETYSSVSMAIANSIGPFSIPIISHYATCECLSDKRKYPSFLRTIPSDYFQSRALAEMVKYFGWTWVGALRRDDDYGNSGMAAFTGIAEQLGICLEYSLPYFRTYSKERVLRIIDQIKISTSRVIIGFLDTWDLESLLQVFFEHNITGYQWVGTEAWIFDPELAKLDQKNILQGAIGLAIPKANVTGLEDFILDVKPLKSVGSAIFPEFWEAMFDCKYTVQNDSEGVPVCTGEEKLSDVRNTFTDMSLMPIFSNVYKGVYAIAHALNNLLHCNKTCSTKLQPDPLTIRAADVPCSLLGPHYPPQLSKEGDVIIGGVFSIHIKWDQTTTHVFTSVPQQPKCIGL
ncbi:extracellular calcium-sensing receptor-like, partial [Clarias magur]